MIWLLFITSLYAETHKINMKSLSFDPNKIELKIGDAVEWINQSFTEHSATSADKKFDTGLIKPKKSSQKISFREPGTYVYQCAVHGKTMSGEITVSAR